MLQCIARAGTKNIQQPPGLSPGKEEGLEALRRAMLFSLPTGGFDSFHVQYMKGKQGPRSQASTASRLKTSRCSKRAATQICWRTPPNICDVASILPYP